MTRRAETDSDEYREMTRQRLAQRVVVDAVSGCWVWTGATRQGKVARLSYLGRATMPAAVSYALHHGRDPFRTDVVHTCHDRRCINPRHLEAVDHEVQGRRAADLLDVYESQTRGGLADRLALPPESIVRFYSKIDRAS